MTSDSENQKPNRLLNEKSPYLLQHAYNPVDWYAWNDEAFERAKKENKPIFLSIGYSTCHWCHVMAHESFEDEEVAQLMNDTFVNIKVDREERPDIDKTYMQVAQMMTGRGGWPLTIIMTPDKKPFYAGTYIPKRMRYNSPGMIELIPRIDELWKTDQENISDVTSRVLEALSSTKGSSERRELGIDDIENAFASYSQRFDDQKGGFGKAPKFPSPHNILLSLRYWKRTGDEWALHMVEKTLTEMRIGGIFDQVGFGFHRYSTDEKWLLPHFEKMLYDQAMLIMAYSETYLTTKKKEYADVVGETIEYLKRDLLSEEGGFYSAEDADSEGEEGKFYFWSLDEVNSLLTPKQAELFIKVYNIKADGNFRDEASGEKTINNIPHAMQPLSKIAEILNIDVDELESSLDSSRSILLRKRAERTRPHLDDKILADWNGLIIAALAKASRALQNPEYLELAENAIAFILAKMRDKDGNLLHRYREGEAAILGFLDDYAFLTWGLIELYHATFKTQYLETAMEFTETLLGKFWDRNNDGFFFTSEESEELLQRQMDAYDGAIPSGNSIAMYNLIRLGRMIGKPEYEEKSARIGARFSEIISRSMGGFSMLLSALDYAIGPTHEVVIAGDPEKEDTKRMIAVLDEYYLPNVTTLLRGTEEQKIRLSEIAAYTKYHESIKGKATAYVCVEQNCRLPTTVVQKILELLDITT